MHQIQEDFLPMNFANQKAKQFVSRLNRKSSLELFKNFEVREYQKGKNLSKIQTGQINKEYFKKVAAQVQFLGYDKDYCMIFGIYGPRIDRYNKYQLIFTITQIIEQSFYSNIKHNGKSKGLKKYSTEGITIIFFNNCQAKKRHKLPFVSSKDLLQPMRIDDFKQEVIKQISLKHLIKINHIILLFPTLLTKSWNYLTSFGIQNAFYDNYFLYMDSVYQPVQLLGPLFQVGNIDSRVLSYDTSLNKNWKDLYSQGQKSKSISDFQSYESMCEYTSTDNMENYSRYKYKVSLNQYFIVKNRNVPNILQLLIQQIAQNHLRFQGIFRKVAEQRQLIKLQNFLHELDYKFINESNKHELILDEIKRSFKNYDIETLTSFFKKIFMQLQIPLIPAWLYEEVSKYTEDQINHLEENHLEENHLEENHLLREVKDQPDKSTYNLCNSTKGSQSKDQQQPRNQFMQKIAFFQNLTNKNAKLSQDHRRKQNPITIQTSKKTQNKAKISFKKTQNGRKLASIKEPSLKSTDILKFSSIKNQFPTNYQTLKSVITFLNKVQKQQRFNLMSCHNLAVCFVPCLFRAQRAPKNWDNQLSLYEECIINHKFVQILAKVIEKPDLYFPE